MTKRNSNDRLAFQSGSVFCVPIIINQNNSTMKKKISTRLSLHGSTTSQMRPSALLPIRTNSSNSSTIIILIWTTPKRTPSVFFMTASTKFPNKPNELPIFVDQTPKQSITTQKMIPKMRLWNFSRVPISKSSTFAPSFRNEWRCVVLECIE